MRADREHDGSTGTRQLVGELHAGGRCTDDEDSAVPNRRRARYRFGVTCSMSGVRPAAQRGTLGVSVAPVAITTFVANHVP